MLLEAKSLKKLSGSSPIDQMVLEMNRWGEAGPSYFRPRVSELTQRRLSGLSPHRSVVLVIARREACPCEQRLTQGLHSLRVGKQLLTSKKSSGKSRQSDSLNKSQLPHSLMGFW